jgi:hypothetical protein
MNAKDQLPRVFQANADRFFQRVILATLDQLPMHRTLVVGEASTMDEFLDRCTAQVDNYTANEAAKAFALTLDGMFERQLSRWAGAHGVNVKDGNQLLGRCAKIASLDLAETGMADDLKELHLVANVVRHGDGRSCHDLKATAPKLWDSPTRDYFDLAPGRVPVSDELRIRAGDLRRYARAVVRFWGHVDPLPNAVLDPPY